MVFHALPWLASVGLTVFLLWTAPRRGVAFVLKAAIAAIVLDIALFAALGFGLRSMNIRPSDAVLTLILQLVMTFIVIAMLNIMNIVFHRMVEAQIAFHKRYNGANLQRMPVSFVIRHADQLKMLGTLFWCLGAGLMLYGLWFHMKLPA